MAIAICEDCKKRFRQFTDGKTGEVSTVCSQCARDQREADREQAAAMAMAARVFGTTDPDELMRR